MELFFRMNNTQNCSREVPKYVASEIFWWFLEAPLRFSEKGRMHVCVWILRSQKLCPLAHSFFLSHAYKQSPFWVEIMRLSSRHRPPSRNIVDVLRSGRMVGFYRTDMDVVSKLWGSLPDTFSDPIQHKSIKQAFSHIMFFLILEVIFHASLEFPGLSPVRVQLVFRGHVKSDGLVRRCFPLPSIRYHATKYGVVVIDWLRYHLFWLVKMAGRGERN